MNTYQDLIREELARAGHVGAADPRHIEAWMRIEHPTLNGLSRSQFTSEVGIALQCVAASTADDNESLARSFGL